MICLIGFVPFVVMAALIIGFVFVPVITMTDHDDDGGGELAFLPIETERKAA